MGELTMDAELSTVSNTLTPDEIMDRAADLIDEYGWGRDQFHNPVTGALCLSGALRRVVNRSSRDYSVLDEVHRYMHNHLGTFVSMWNDRDCQDQNEATEFLRSEAKRYREENS
jgi:hypothetical protein